MKKKLVLIRHGDGPSDDRVVNWASLNEIEIEVFKPFRGEVIPDLHETTIGTVIYGGKYEAYAIKEFPFLKNEYSWIEQCLNSNTPMLGICQGAQQIAHHLGAKVGPVDNSIGEFGYYQINPTKDANEFLKSSLHVAQAHYHTFDIPKDAVKLAGSELFSNQAFKVQQNVYGLQFHAEVTIEGFRRWQNSGWPSRLGHQTIEEQTRLMHKHDAAQASWFYDFLNNLFL